MSTGEDQIVCTIFLKKVEKQIHQLRLILESTEAKQQRTRVAEESESR